MVLNTVMNSTLITNSPRVHIDLMPVGEQEYYEVSIKQKESLENRKHNVKADNLCQYFELNHPHIEAFKSAFYELIKRHEILRTTFTQGESGFKQRIYSLEGFGFKIEEFDLTVQTEKYNKLIEIYQQASNYTFDVEIGPLMKAILCKVSDIDYIFIFTIDHAICD